MRLRPTWAATLAGVLILCGCGGDGSEGGLLSELTTSPTTTISPTSAVTTTFGTAASSTTATTLAPTTTAPPVAPAVRVLTDPEGLIAEYESSISLPDDPLGNSPDYESTAAFIDEIDALGIDLTGVDVWVWPLLDSDEVLLVFDVDERAESLEDSDLNEALGMATATSPALEAAGVTRFVMHYRGSDADGPFFITYTLSWDVLRSAILEDASLEPEDGTLRLSREG